MDNSISDMFKVSNALLNQKTEAERGLDAFKNYLQVENGINKNFQDALTFNDSVKAINALNQYNAFKSQNDLEKLQGEAERVAAIKPYLFDPNSGRYRHESEVARLAQGDLNNPYAAAANYQAAQKAGEQLASNLAVYNPEAANWVRHESGAFGAFAPSVQQLRDGSVVVNNGSYKRVLSPEEANYAFMNPEKHAASIFGWEHDNDVAGRDHELALDKMNRQNQLNKESYAFQNGLQDKSWLMRSKVSNAMERENANIKFKNQKELEEYKWQKQLEFEKAKYDLKNKIEQGYTINSDDIAKIYNSAVAANIPPEEAGKYAYGYVDFMRQATGQQSAVNPYATADAAIGGNGNQANATNPTPTANAFARTPTNEPSRPYFSFAEDTRFGNYSLPLYVKETRAEALANLDAAIKDMEARYNENVKIAPNSYRTLNQAKALQEWRAARKQFEKMSDAGYFARKHPFNSIWNAANYGTVTKPNTSKLK